jgi:hypothetical protein
MELTMSEDKAESTKPFDPLESFRGMRDAYLDGMAKAMVEAVNTEGYAQATGAMLENSLTISAPFRDAMEKSMLQVLQQLSLPSRQDFAALADRFTNMEMRLDDMDAKLDRIEKQTHAVKPVATDEPAKPSDSSPKAPTTKRVAPRAPVATKRASKKQAQTQKRTARKGTR